MAKIAIIFLKIAIIYLKIYFPQDLFSSSSLLKYKKYIYLGWDYTQVQF